MLPVVSPLNHDQGGSILLSLYSFTAEASNYKAITHALFTASCSRAQWRLLAISGRTPDPATAWQKSSLQSVHVANSDSMAPLVWMPLKQRSHAVKRKEHEDFLLSLEISILVVDNWAAKSHQWLLFTYYTATGTSNALDKITKGCCNK